MKVIILSLTNYKEKDCIYNALSEEGYISFQGKGAQDPKGKFVWLNNPLTIADVEFSEDGRYKHKLLKNAAPVSSPLTGEYELEYLYSIYALAEITQSILMDEEKHLAFNDLLGAIKALKNKKDCYMVVLVYLAKLLKFSGTQVEVDRCVFCGSVHNIATFSFENGGFVCANCMTEDLKRDYKKEQMKLLRFIFKAPDFSYIQDDLFTLEDKKLILKKLKEFADDGIGVTLKTLDYLIK